MLEQDGQSYYVELRAWHSHLDHNDDHHQNGHDHDVLMSRPLVSRTKPDALKGLMSTDYAISLSSQHPSIQDANFLWDKFERNANPLMKIDFDWALEQVRSKSTSFEGRMGLQDEDHAFVFCLYLMSIVTIPDHECLEVLHQPQQVLLSHYQAICEQALSRSNIFCITNVTVIRAILLYIAASIERLSLHRDGAILGLSPAETENRRRLWWYLQHLDLALGVRCGTTPLTLMAEWDWHAFISVIVEVTQLKGSPKAQRTWDLLSNLYTHNKNLLELSEDRRKLHAAELIINAWKARQTVTPSAPVPLCISVLEPLLSDHRSRIEHVRSEAAGQPLELVMTDEDLNELLGLEFQDIDWAFWAGMK
ncbi:hypothetical protein KCU78_g751, partial [Aureobasidium melanogenum]